MISRTTSRSLPTSCRAAIEQTARPLAAGPQARQALAARRSQHAQQPPAAASAVQSSGTRLTHACSRRGCCSAAATRTRCRPRERATVQPWIRGPSYAARRGVATGAAAGSGPPGQETMWGVLMKAVEEMQALAGQQQAPQGAHVHVEGLCFQPPGAAQPLLTDVRLTLPPNQLGLVFGRSGAGKTTLLQLVAGLAQPTRGVIGFEGPPAPGAAAAGLRAEERMAAAGLVFQFPERHFIGASMSQELVVGWPVAPDAFAARQALSMRAHEVLAAVGLAGVPLDAQLSQLSDGYKRRVALAVQLVRRPRLLLLDEPLAGLDWRTRGELVAVLAALKRQCTVLVVSHDLRELAPLVDAAWEMRPGGRLRAADADALPTLQ